MQQNGNDRNKYTGNGQANGYTPPKQNIGKKGGYNDRYAQQVTQFRRQEQTAQSHYNAEPAKKKHLRVGVVIAIIAIACVICLGVAGYVIYQKSTAPVLNEDGTVQLPGENASRAQKEAYVKQYTGRFADNIYLDGIEIGGKTLQEAQQLVQQHINTANSGWSLKLVYQGHEFIELTDSLVGITFDVEQINNDLNAAYAIGHSGNIDQDYDAIIALQSDPCKIDTVKSGINRDLIQNYLEQIAQNIAKEPSNAYLASFNPDKEDPFTIVEEVYGVNLDVNKCLDEIVAMAAAGKSGTYIINPDYIYPEVTSVDVRKTVTLLATGTTPVNSTSTQNRTNNIRVAFSKINGLILENGKSFSFNTVVGKRTVKNGFMEAPAYANNETVMQIGGGVCQASSTIYVAAVCANLKITHREPHSMAVNYCDFGMDATVNGEGKVIDFTFNNNSGAKIYITAHVESNNSKKQPYRCVVKIYGTAFEDGVSYRMRSEEIETIVGADLEPILKYDDGTYGLIYQDQLKLVKNAVDGHVVVTYKQKLLNGSVVEETKISEDTYPAQAAVYYRGTDTPLP